MQHGGFGEERTAEQDASPVEPLTKSRSRQLSSGFPYVKWWDGSTRLLEKKAAKGQALEEKVATKQRRRRGVGLGVRRVEGGRGVEGGRSVEECAGVGGTRPGRQEERPKLAWFGFVWGGQTGGLRRFREGSEAWRSNQLIVSLVHRIVVR